MFRINFEIKIDRPNVIGTDIATRRKAGWNGVASPEAASA
jgi:hypothetical protein